MSNGHDIRDHHRHFHHHKNMFLPMFCRLSIKDIITHSHHRKNPISTPASPSSPKVSCMGQVKRSNRVVGFPPAAAVAHHHRHSRLRNLFSTTTKTLFPPAAPITSAAGDGARGRSKSFKKLKFTKNTAECEKQEDRVAVVDISEIDPPLPVVKRAGAGSRDEVNLWRRRSNGAAALKGLQIEQSIITRLPNTHHHSSVVISQRPTQTV